MFFDDLTVKGFVVGDVAVFDLGGDEVAAGAAEVFVAGEAP